MYQPLFDPSCYVPSLSQILQVLEGMGMSAYMEIFYRENINGELLVELNDAILEKEIGIMSQDHRTKLVQLISGTQSVRAYLHC